MITPSKNKKTKLLILGGGGYIGSRLYEELDTINYEIDTVDLEWYSPSIQPNNKIDVKDLTKEYILSFDVVIYLSAHASAKMGKDGMSSIHNNLWNFINILDMLQHTHVKFIYASSSSVYGKSGSYKRVESDSEFSPENFYDLTKKDMDNYASLYDVESYGLRFGTVNGWSPHLRVDIMLNSMFQAAKIGNIVANNIDVHRPILDISDLCNVIKVIITSRKDQRGVYNIASFNGTVGGIASSAASIMKCGINYQNNPDSSAYDFSISTEKFENAFKFKFLGTVKSIIDSLYQSSMYKTDRNKPIHYRI